MLNFLKLDTVVNLKENCVLSHCRCFPIMVVVSKGNTMSTDLRKKMTNSAQTSGETTRSFLNSELAVCAFHRSASKVPKKKSLLSFKTKKTFHCFCCKPSCWNLPMQLRWLDRIQSQYSATVYQVVQSISLQQVRQQRIEIYLLNNQNKTQNIKSDVYQPNFSIESHSPKRNSTFTTKVDFVFHTL